MPSLQTPYLYSLTNIVLLLSSLKGTCHNCQNSRRVMENFLSSEGNHVLIEGRNQWQGQWQPDGLACSFSAWDMCSPATPCPACTSFLLLLWQITKDLMSENKTNVLSIGPKCNACLTGLKARGRQACILFLRLKRKNHFLAFSGF